MKLFKEIDIDDGLIWVNIRMNLKSLESLLTVETRCLECDSYGCLDCKNGQTVQTYNVDNIEKLKSSLSETAIKEVRRSIKGFVDLFGDV